MTQPEKAAAQEAGSERTGPQEPGPQKRRPGPDAVVLRPRLLLICAWAGAVAILVIFAVVAYLMPAEDTGVIFRPADQISMMVLGVLIAGGLLLMARPRVRADTRGIEVRNIAAAHWFAWSDIEGVAFPDGTSWARLDLPDDEYHPVLAVQAVDRQRAVDGIRRLRALHRDAVHVSGPERAEQ